MDQYLKAGLVTIAILVVIFSAISVLENNRQDTLNRGIEDLTIQSETSRLLFFYSQVFSGDVNAGFCNVMKSSANLRSDEGDVFFSKLSAYENANLLGNFDSLKKKYVLNRVELWLYSTLLNQRCDTNVVSVLFFYPSKKPCPECDVQGEILDEIRTQCPNVKIFALSVDDGVDIVSLIEAQFGVSSVPSLVIQNKTVFDKLASRDDLMRHIACDANLPPQ